MDILFTPIINNFTFVEFIGFVSSKIVYSVTKRRWEIIKTFENKIVAYMNSTSNLPIEPNNGILQTQIVQMKGKCIGH